MLRSYFNSHLYVLLAPDRLEVRNPDSGKSFIGPPELAIKRSSKKVSIVAFGADARPAQAHMLGVEVLNPFTHPRSLVSDFTVAEHVLKAVFRSLSRGALSPAPRVVMHPLGDPEGGWTQIEIRALREMALGAGAREVKIWQGQRLTDEQLLSRQFPPQGTVLE